MAEASSQICCSSSCRSRLSWQRPGGVAVGIGAVIGQQQQRGDGRFSEASGRVDARREREADGRGRDRPSLRAAIVQQRADAGARVGVDLRQTLRHEVAVFAREGHDVGHRADGDKVAVVAQHLRAVALERAQQLERHAHTSEPAVGILRAGTLRVHDGHGVRDRLPAAFVVVGDDHVDAALQGVVRLVDGGDAAVDGDDERDIVGALEACDRVHVQAVALLDAVGDVRVHGHATAAQIVREHARRRDAVDVVVAKDGHVLPPLDGGADARDGLVHVLQEHGVEHALVAAAEKGARLHGVVIAAQRQQHRQQRGIARAQQRLRRLRRGIWNFPVTVFHMRCVPQIQNDRLYNNTIIYYSIKISAQMQEARVGYLPPPGAIFRRRALRFLPLTGMCRRWYDMAGVPAWRNRQTQGT